jgi:hypothetical protein
MQPTAAKGGVPQITESDPPNLCEIAGNLMCTDDTIIVQQCNCLTVKPHGLSAQIAAKFPYANVYTKRHAIGRRNLAKEPYRARTGSVEMCKPFMANEGPKVACLFAQWECGRPGVYNRCIHPDGLADDATNRIRWFASSLHAMGLLVAPHDSISLPWSIGCGLAGGKWPVYRQLIVEFAYAHPENKITIYRRE